MLKKKPTPLAKSVASTTAKPILKRPLRSPASANPQPAEAEGEEPDAGEKIVVKAKAEAKPNPEVVELISTFDSDVKKAEESFIALVAFIQENEVDRATVIASMMQARGISYESAQKEYGKMKKIFNNETVLEELKSGAISLKVAKEKVKTPQKNPASAKPEAKEAKFTNTLKNFVAAAKESGFARKEIMVTVEAELKTAGIK